MIKLKPIVNEILLKEEEQVTWADVAREYQGILKAQKKETRKGAAKFLVKTGLSLIPAWGAASGAVSGAVDQALKFLDSDVLIKTVDFAKNSKDWLPGVIKATLSLGKSFSNSQLKNPKASEFKKLTGPFWKKIKLSDEVSIMLDDNVEAMFINQVLLPKLQEPGSANEPLPNMDELLGKWLNDKGLTANADIQFKGKSGDLSEATMNAEEMARHKKKLEKLKKYLAKQGDQMMAYPADLPNTVFNSKLINTSKKVK